MNKLIQELADQCWDEYPNTGPVVFNKEKFAELIIQEALAEFKDRIATRNKGSKKDCDIAYGMEIVCYDIADKFKVEFK